MTRPDYSAVWPRGRSTSLSVPDTALHTNLEISAQRYPDKPCLVYYDARYSYRQVLEQVQALAGFLQHDCGVSKGDRVLLYMQNSPQFVLAYYAILRADAVVVPVNPMNRADELQHYIRDTEASVIVYGQELHEHIATLGRNAPAHKLVAAYHDYLPASGTDLAVPEVVATSAKSVPGHGVVLWQQALAKQRVPLPSTVTPADLAVMPYTSGTTGHPKGCMHTHRSTMYNTVSPAVWYDAGNQDAVYLGVLPFFHVTGMEGVMNSAIYLGATTVIMTRWDRVVAAQCIERYRVGRLALIAAMVVDLLAMPDLADFDLSSISRVSGGGAAMPEAVAAKLHRDFGLTYLEGYGMSEVMAPTHINPEQHPKRQCLGIPIFDVDARIIDPATLQEVAQGEVGEIIVHGPQLMQGYWNNPQATADVFIQLDGKHFLRTGDLGRMDEEGYYFMVDRLKRMINASGYKVWPAEVETMLYAHPAVLEACVVGVVDEKRGETVKAWIVLQEHSRGKVTEQELLAWCREKMASYKAPKIVAFTDALPKTSSGKVLWRTLG
ncbi:long-chain fatty acid--CoA ligase [Advenella kashmirensis W13003]|uniref:Long-chain fatty acid--CoA ligase n=1 Tax=Advenella kashmirensis W13003 TaxID=1424334 RepID=V8QL83_9BURK|nr:long-chain fatty acid--CoA ligase [Advenella kashmirensis]ETF00721.1 long-chain fatty acid--CoA ligase [Advenella kashmirensis W13003]